MTKYVVQYSTYDSGYSYTRGVEFDSFERAREFANTQVETAGVTRVLLCKVVATAHATARWVVEEPQPDTKGE